MKFLATIGAFVIVTPIVLIVGLLGLLWRAWWLYPAWTWFFVPIGLPAITIWHFSALMLLIGTFTNHIDTREDKRPQSWANMAVMFIWPIIAWVTLRWLH